MALGPRSLDYASLQHVWPARSLLRSLVVRQLRSNYAGSAGGGWWLVLRPLIVVLAYYFVFDRVLAVRLNLAEAGTDTYALYLLSGLIPWMAWSDGVVQGCGSLNQGADLVRKTRLPVEMIPARAVLAAAAGFLPVTVLVALAGILWAQSSPLALVLLPLWLLLQVAMTYYLALALAILAAALRDIGYLVQTLFGTLIFFSPVLFPLERVPESMRALLWLNPFTVLANGYHAIVLRGELPAWPDLLGGLCWLLLLMFAAHVLLRRSREQLVDWL